MTDRIETLDQVRASAIDLGMRFGPKLFIALVILIAGILVSRWAGTATGRLLRRFELEPPVLQLVASAAQLTVFGLFAIMALQNLGVELLPLIAGLGVAGAGVALAMQGVLRDKTPVVQTSQLDDWSVKIAIRPWVTVADYGAAGGEINKAILETFRSRGIVMPVPQRDVRLLGEYGSGTAGKEPT